MKPDHEMMIGRERVLATDGIDEHAVGERRQTRPERVADRVLPFTFDLKNATLTRPSSSAGNP
jgi:hypothetical protein